MNGLVMIDKPAGCTSHDVVNRWRKLADTKRVGHTGTLDPMATGLLALVTGTSTRLSQFFGKEEKTYVAEITFGATSDTYDIEGEVIESPTAPEISAAALDAALAKFRGVILQKPPAISAKKIKGVPAYKLARKNEPVHLEPVEVEITRLDVLRLNGAKAELRVVCSAGTYIRSLAHDLGEALGCGAVLSKLRRTRVGDLQVEDARTLDELSRMAEEARLAEAVMPAGTLLSHLPAQHFDASAEVQIRQGKDFHTSPFVVPPGAPLVRALTRSGDLIAIGQLKIPNLYHPGTVL